MKRKNPEITLHTDIHHLQSKKKYQLAVFKSKESWIYEASLNRISIIIFKWPDEVLLFKREKKKYALAPALIQNLGKKFFLFIFF